VPACRSARRPFGGAKPSCVLASVKPAPMTLTSPYPPIEYPMIPVRDASIRPLRKPSPAAERRSISSITKSWSRGRL
jgi:hypothetical protein